MNIKFWEAFSCALPVDLDLPFPPPLSSCSSPEGAVYASLDESEVFPCPKWRQKWKNSARFFPLSVIPPTLSGPDDHLHSDDQFSLLPLKRLQMFSHSFRPLFFSPKNGSSESVDLSCPLLFMLLPRRVVCEALFKYGDWKFLFWRTFFPPPRMLLVGLLIHF